MGDLSPWHLLIIAGVFVLLFGAKKLPDAARSLGKSARILKTELKDIHDEDDPGKQAAQLAAAPVAPPAAVPAAPVAPPAAVPEATVTPPAVVVTEAPAQPVSSGDQTPAS